jgi:hypothetical protein
MHTQQSTSLQKDLLCAPRPQMPFVVPRASQQCALQEKVSLAKVFWLRCKVRLDNMPKLHVQDWLSIRMQRESSSAVWNWNHWQVCRVQSFANS